MPQFKDNVQENLRNARLFTDLPTIRVNFWRKIYYFFNPTAKYRKQRTEQDRKNTRRLQNKRYYARHRDELREKRRDYYESTGK